MRQPGTSKNLIRMAKRGSFRRRVLLGLAAYTLALTVAVVTHGYIFNETAEQLVWTTLLDTELDHIVERQRSDPDYRWIQRDSVSYYDDIESGRVPEAFAGLSEGVHDDVIQDGIEHVVLVRVIDGRKVVLALDIGELEQQEFDTSLVVLWSAITMIAILGIALAWGTDRLIRPLTRLADRISKLRPDQPGQRIEGQQGMNTELYIITEALNDYLGRNDNFVKRERDFIDTASHELRTPIAVIAGASEIALQQDASPAIRSQLTRIRRTARDVEQLITLLLMLAKDPTRLARMNDTVPLDQLVQEIVEDHLHLTRDKDLGLTVASLAAIEIQAPLLIVQAAIGNLLRNAIENSDRGEIVVSLYGPATVKIVDPGHGMTPEEISAVYARLARGSGERGGAGIGLELISRLCEHLGWRLEISSDGAQGTTTILSFEG